MKSIKLNLFISFLILITACSVRNKPVVVKFEGPFTEKKWAIADVNPELPSDWSSYGFLTFEMNSTTTQRFDLLLYDAEGTRRLVIQPFQGARVRASIPLVHFQKRNTQGMDMAAIGKTARPGYWIGFTGAVGSIKKVDSLGIAMRLPIGSPSIEFNNFRLTMTAEDTIFDPRPLVDEFGQWIPADWPGKAKTFNDLNSAWKEEENSLNPGDFNVSKYGGFLSAKTKATGFFRVEKIDGKWWFVDPEGYLFFSSGSCCIVSGFSFSRIRGREYIFTAMPPSDELNPPNQTERRAPNTSFYTWNLYRRFGSDWYQKWIDLTIERMDSWGINTIGNWSDATLGGSHRKPYVATLRGWGIETGIMGMPDVYAPDYLAKVDSAAAQQCAQRKNDPYLLGYFLGNEPPWPGRESDLVNVILTGNETPMKTALKKYLSGGDTPERRKAFVYDTFSKFIGIVNAAIKKHDPNHLNLGLRYGGTPPDDLIKASIGFDVFSLNIYGYDTNSKLDRVYNLTGLPIIIGEFHFGTPGRGLAPGLAQTRDQEERGVAYRYYVENAAAHPSLIGTHWFQWTDQPCTGRNDGENYNIGFLDVTDRPYKELIDASKETFKKLLNIHSGKIAPVSRQAITQ
jgi:hypothetical protein